MSDLADDQRNMNEIAPEEIDAAGMHVLRQQIGMPFDVWVSETARLPGFQRCGPTIRKFVSTALQVAIDEGRVGLTSNNAQVKLRKRKRHQTGI